MEETKLAVLIDFENLAAGAEKEGHGRFDIRAVMRRLKDKGRILVARSYADWGRFAKFKQNLLEQGVSMIELTSYRGAEKNRADIALVVDAMELAYTRDYLDTFVLLSGDSDFTPLVMRLKELNKRVIGIGNRGSTSRLIVEACDEFIFYESLQKREEMRTDRAPEQRAPRLPRAVREEQREEEVDSADTLPKEEAFALAVETLEGIQKDEPGPVLAGLLKQSLQRKEPTFDESDYGYSGFARFLEAIRDKGLVVLLRDERAGGYRVDLPGSEPIEMPAPAPEREPAAEADLAPLAGDAGRWRDMLEARGFNPLTHFMRHTVVHEFVDHVQERQARKKRNTLTYVPGDIARRCRKTEPVVPPRYVTAVINALRTAGELKHGDGNPVRSTTAHFTLNKDAEELLESLNLFYLDTLLATGEDLDDHESLSMLLWGDREHADEVRRLVQWVHIDRAGSSTEDGSPVATADFDDFEHEDDVPAPSDAPEETSAKADGDDGEAVDDADTAEAPPLAVVREEEEE